MSNPKIHIEQDVIDTLEPVGREVLDKLLSMDWDKCLLTDLSSLSDFTGNGDTPAELQALATRATYQEYCLAWDAWLLARFEQLYGFRPQSTTTPLVQLLSRIEEARKPQQLH